MSITIYTIHEPDAEHLAEVTEIMRKVGAPVIDVVDCGDHYMALEGCHRLAAAAALDIIPYLHVYEQDELIDISGYDWYEIAQWDGTTYPAGEVAGKLHHTSNGMVNIPACILA